MKKTVQIILNTLLLCCFYTGFAQLPVTDNLSSVGGTGEWYNASGQSSMGVETSSMLCYNIGVNYSDAQIYEWRSPDYSTTLDDNGCLTVRYSARITLNIRVNGDIMYMGYYDNAVWSYAFIPYAAIGWTTFYIDVPSTTSQFSLYFNSNGSGSRTGKYVHVDWVTLECIDALPVELVEFKGEPREGQNLLTWITDTELNNERFDIQRSIDGKEWVRIGVVEGKGTTIQRSYYKFIDHHPLDISYYRLKQVDIDGGYEYSNIIVLKRDKEENKEVFKVINLLGQEVSDSYRGPVIIIYLDGTYKKTIQ